MGNIKRFDEFMNEKNSSKNEDGKNLNENLDEFDSKFQSIAAQIEKGFTNGEEPEEWELEVNLKDWVKLDDDDIDYIAAQIRSGNTEGNDPIDWSISFGGDSFDIEEEEELTKKDIANQIDIDEEDFEDSADMGDMANKIIEDHETYEFTLDEVNELFDAYVDSNDVSRFFSATIAKDFAYDKEKALFDDIIKYYPIFEEEYGYLEEFGSEMFNNILKGKIKNFLKR